MPLTILNGPSAGGKTTLMEKILKGAHGQPSMHGIHQLITVTTRPPRPNERDGVDYHFMTRKEFNALDRKGEMVEKTTYAGVKYGILKRDLEPLFDPNHHAIAVLDFFGYAKLVEFLGKERVNLVFVHAAFETLKQRMEARGMEKKVIRRRLKQAVEREMVGKAFAHMLIDTDGSEDRNYLDLREDIDRFRFAMMSRYLPNHGLTITRTSA